MQVPRLELLGPHAVALAEEFGTPLYVVSEEGFRARLRRYQSVLASCAEKSGVSFASKANTALALARIAYEEGCTVDGSSEGELRGPLLAGVPAASLHFHGNVKLKSELEWALEEGIGEIIIDSFEEIAMLSELNLKSTTKFLLRVAPGVNVHTHDKIATGVVQTKFGIEIPQIEEAVRLCLEANLNLVGLHQHVGSMLLSSDAQAEGARRLAQLALDIRTHFGLEMQELNLGGGYGVLLAAGLPPEPLEEYVRKVVSAAQEVLTPAGMNPKYVMEPGRAVTADCGVTLYRICVVKESGGRKFVSVDGGLSDNPSPALYGRRFTGRFARESEAETETVTISGAHCETDTLFESAVLPSDVRPGDILEVLGTGAYQASMASNYNRFRRPAMILLTSDGPKIIQERETWDQLFVRERLQ